MEVKTHPVEGCLLLGRLGGQRRMQGTHAQTGKEVMGLELRLRLGLEVGLRLGLEVGLRLGLEVGLLVGLWQGRQMGLWLGR